MNPIETHIKSFQDGTTAQGKPYTRFNTDQGWLSVFNAKHIEVLKAHQGKSIKLYTTTNERGYVELRDVEVIQDSAGSTILPARPDYTHRDYAIYAQVALKCAVELLVAGKITYEQLDTEAAHMVTRISALIAMQKQQ